MVVYSGISSAGRLCSVMCSAYSFGKALRLAQKGQSPPLGFEVDSAVWIKNGLASSTDLRTVVDEKKVFNVFHRCIDTSKGDLGLGEGGSVGEE